MHEHTDVWIWADERSGGECFLLLTHVCCPDVTERSRLVITDGNTRCLKFELQYSLIMTDAVHSIEGKTSNDLRHQCCKQCSCYQLDGCKDCTSISRFIGVVWRTVARSAEVWVGLSLRRTNCDEVIVAMKAQRRGPFWTSVSERMGTVSHGVEPVL